ncbi:alpha/beta hydrolase [Psychrobacter sp.]|uniref:alpha/beta fold hydrolase n=1 Tax=Psychrobacter sp. TaxID=56811 RepID=UPI0025F2AA2D|nr:alpha/beta hydrolase [Psychrobacter sp.]
MTLSPPEFKTDKFFNLKDSWIQTDSDEITHYYDQGEGIPVLLLHGSGSGTSAAMTWWQNIPHISRDYRAIAFDSIGYGETISAPDSSYGIKQWGEHTLRLMDALGIDKAWLVGSSLGGWIALQLAIDHPQRLYGVVSIGTGGTKKTKRPKTVRPQNNKTSLSADLIRQDLLKNICNEEVVSETLVKLRYQAAVKEQANGLRTTLLAARDNDREHLPLDFLALGQLPLPVLLIHGMNDKVVPLSRSFELLEAMPNADAHFYSHAGHWPHIGKASEFNNLLLSYLKNHA